MLVYVCVCVFVCSSAAFYAPQLLEQNGCLSIQTFVAICNPLLSLTGKLFLHLRQKHRHAQTHTDVSVTKQNLLNLKIHLRNVSLLKQWNMAFMLHLLLSSQQKPPNNDWRFTQGQRPGPSGWVNWDSHTPLTFPIMWRTCFCAAQGELIVKTEGVIKDEE